MALIDEIGYIRDTFFPGRTMMKKLLLNSTLTVVLLAAFYQIAPARTFDPDFTMVQDIITVKPVEPVAADCYKIDQYIPGNIDMAKLRQTWLDWNNDLRLGAGLKPYVLEPELDWSAQNWSDRAKRLGVISHKRDGSNAYYDYRRILNWFKDLNLEFQNVHGSTYTENIGWGFYKCPADGSDCTPAMTTAIKTTLDFFARERQSNGAHWRSMMNKDFQEIGLGLALDRVKHKYYLTIHYATAITSHPKAICLNN